MIAYKVCFRQINPPGGFKNVVFIEYNAATYVFLFITNKEGGREGGRRLENY